MGKAKTFEEIDKEIEELREKKNKIQKQIRALEALEEYGKNKWIFELEGTVEYIGLFPDINAYPFKIHGFQKILIRIIDKRCYTYRGPVHEYGVREHQPFKVGDRVRVLSNFSTRILKFEKVE